MTRDAWAYWVARPGAGELRAEALPPAPRVGHSVVRAECSGVSPGTERLVGLGLVPPECAATMACRSMAGDFALPVKYGYCLVGSGVAGALTGRRVFVMHPHQDLAEVRDADATELPATLPSARATLIPNLETALNAVWDAELAADERAVVWGAGPVGLLVGFVLWRQRGRRVVVVETEPARAARAAGLPWVEAAVSPEEVGARGGAAAGAQANVAFHCTGSEAGLRSALAALAFEGRVMELSWYGRRPVTLELGTHFHGKRLRIVASQVGTIARAKRGTHDFAARLREVLGLMAEEALDLLLDPPVAFAEMPQFMAGLYRGETRALVPTIGYGDG